MENSELRLIVGLKINEGQLEKFKSMAQEIAGSVEATEPNTTAYEWFINDTGDKCYVSESYPDSSALMSHLQNVGSALGPLLEIAPLTEMLVFGTPSIEATEVLSGFGAQIFPSIAGFSR